MCWSCYMSLWHFCSATRGRSPFLPLLSVAALMRHDSYRISILYFCSKALLYKEGQPERSKMNNKNLIYKEIMRDNHTQAWGIMGLMKPKGTKAAQAVDCPAATAENYWKSIGPISLKTDNDSTKLLTYFGLAPLALASLKLWSDWSHVVVQQKCKKRNFENDCRKLTKRCSQIALCATRNTQRAAMTPPHVLHSVHCWCGADFMLVINYVTKYMTKASCPSCTTINRAAKSLTDPQVR